MMKKICLIGLVLLTVLTLISLALNGVTIYALLRARQNTLAMVEDARDVIGGIGDDTVSYTVTIEHEIPVSASVPFKQEIDVPVNTTIPIDTTVIVPINAGILGTFDIEIPIRTFVPLSLEIAVPIDEMVEVDTTVPLDLEVPVEVTIADTPMYGHLEELDEALARLENRLTELPFGGEEE